MRCLKFGDFCDVVQMMFRPMTTEQKNKQFVASDISSAQCVTHLFVVPEEVELILVDVPALGGVERVLAVPELDDGTVGVAHSQVVVHDEAFQHLHETPLQVARSEREGRLKLWDDK